MGYIKSYTDRRGNTTHINPYYNESFMRSIGKDKYGRPIKYKSKKKKRRTNK